MKSGEVRYSGEATLLGALCFAAVTSLKNSIKLSKIDEVKKSLKTVKGCLVVLMVQNGIDPKELKSLVGFEVDDSMHDAIVKHLEKGGDTVNVAGKMDSKP